MRAQNLTLLTDLYELTMMQGYFKNPTDQIVVFDAFYRKNPCGGAYAISVGLEQVIEYVRDLHFSPDDIDYLRSLHLFEDDFLEYLRGFHFTGDIYAIPEGTVVFPREPIIKVIAPVMEAQLLETAILNMINHQALIATKASRVVYAARGDGIMEFGLRRAQGPDAGIYGARAAMIGGCIGTSNVLTGQMFNVPVSGTHAHSWIMSFPDEYTAFKTYAHLYPNACILLVDTYDVLKSGIPNAIRVFKEMRDAGMNLTGYGIRIDSGDLAYLSKKAYEMLEAAGFPSQDFILSQKGAYMWNPAWETEVDTDRFESLCRRILDPELDGKNMWEACLEAFELYRGIFLPRSAEESWVGPMAAYYHTLYQKLVVYMAEELIRNKEYAQVEEICQRAIGIDRFAEDFTITGFMLRMDRGNRRLP